MATIASLDVNLGLESGKFRRELNAARKATSRATRGMGMSVNNLSSGFARTVRNVGLLGTAFTALAGKAVVATTASFEDLRTTLQSVTGDGAMAFDFLATFATKTQFGVADLSTAFIKLKTAGITPTEKLLTTFTDTAAVTTDQIGTLEAITDLFSRSVSGGLGLEDLNRLADRGVPAFRILEEQLGLTRLEVSAFGKSAEGASKIQQALIKGLDAEFGGSTASRLKNISTLFSNFIISLRRGADVLGTEFSPGLKAITNRLTEFVIGSGDNLKKLGRFINALLLDFDRQLGRFFDNFETTLKDVLSGLKGFGQGVVTIADILSGFVKGIGVVVESLGFLGGVLGGSGAELAGMGAALLLIAGPLVKIAGLVGKLGSALFAFSLSGGAAAVFSSVLSGIVAFATSPLVIFGTLLTAVIGTLGFVSAGQGTLTEKVNAYGSALKRANEEQGIFRAGLEAIKSVLDATGVAATKLGLLLEKNALLNADASSLNPAERFFANQAQTEAGLLAVVTRLREIDAELKAIEDGPSIADGIEARLGVDYLASLSNSYVRQAGGISSNTGIGRVRLQGDAEQGRPRLPSTRSSFNFSGSRDAGRPTGFSLGDTGLDISLFGVATQREAAALVRARKEEAFATRLLTDSINLDTASIAKQVDRRAEALRTIERLENQIATRAELSIIPLPTEGPVSRPERSTLGPQGGGREVLDSELLNLKNTGLEFADAVKLTSSQLEELVTARKRLSLIDNQLLNTATLTTQQIAVLNSQRMAEIDTIESVQAAVQRLSLVADTASDFAGNFNSNLRNGFEAALASSKNFTNFLVSSFTNALTDALLDKAFEGLTDKFAGDLFSTVAGGFSSLFGSDLSAFGGAGADIPARARGGPVTGGSPVLIGERGPEIFVPATDGMVATNDRLNELINGGGGLNVNIPLTVIGDVTEATQRAVQSMGRDIADIVTRIQQERGRG